MDTVIYGGARAPRTAVAKRKKANSQGSFFAQFMGALRESRSEEARRVIAKHAHLLSSDPWPARRDQPKVRP
jgi:hypothetical protein